MDAEFNSLVNEHSIISLRVADDSVFESADRNVDFNLMKQRHSQSHIERKRGEPICIPMFGSFSKDPESGEKNSPDQQLER